jgi:hypothetical protein
MSFTVEQKSLLTKLMASENLTVEHQKIHTAKFDPKNRVLYLPIWQDMTGFMYDHLGGHEVGHAHGQGYGLSAHYRPASFRAVWVVTWVRHG